MLEENTIPGRLPKIDRLILKADNIYNKYKVSGVVSNSEIEKLDKILLKLGSMDDEVEDKVKLVNYRKKIISMINDMTSILNKRNDDVIAQ